MITNEKETNKNNITNVSSNNSMVWNIYSSMCKEWNICNWVGGEASMKLEGSIEEIKQFFNTFTTKDRKLEKEQLEQAYQYTNEKMSKKM